MAGEGDVDPNGLALGLALVAGKDSSSPVRFVTFVILFASSIKSSSLVRFFVTFVIFLFASSIKFKSYSYSYESFTKVWFADVFVELLVFVALKEVELVFVLVLLTVVLLDVEELVLVLLRVVFVVLLVVVTRRMTLDQQRAAHPPAPSSSRHAVQATAHVAVAF